MDGITEILIYFLLAAISIAAWRISISLDEAVDLLKSIRRMQHDIKQYGGKQNEQNIGGKQYGPDDP